MASGVASRFSNNAVAVVDTEGPGITVTRTPEASPAGWDHRPVTFEFDCWDWESAVQVCPGPVTIAAEGGGQSVNVQASDALGNISTYSATVNIDLTSPTVAIVSPTTWGATAATSVDVEVAAADSGSGLERIRCNGVSVTPAISGSTFCSVPLRPGRNLVTIQAVDHAGHATSVARYLTRTAPATSLDVQPSRMTMLVGDRRPLRVLTDLGDPVTTGLTWTPDAAGIVTVTQVGGEAEVIADAVGITTVTATNGTLGGTLTVEVIAGTTASAGTMAWGTSPPSGWRPAFVFAGPGDQDGPTIVTIESPSNGGDGAARLRAVDANGADKWTEYLPLGPAERVSYATSSLSGGALVLTDNYDVDGAQTVILTAPPAVGTSWRYEVRGRVANRDSISSKPMLAQAHDGTVFLVVEEQSHRYVRVIDGETGSVRASISVPSSRRKTWHEDCNLSQPYELPCSFSVSPAEVSSPVVDEEGTAYLTVSSHTTYSRYLGPWGPGVGEYSVLTRVTATTQLLAVTSAGAASWTTLQADADEWEAGRPDVTAPDRVSGVPGVIVPRPGGGVVALWTQRTRSASSPEGTLALKVTSGGAGSAISVTHAAITSPISSAVLTGDGIILASGFDGVVALNSQSGALLSTFADRRADVALADGGFASLYGSWDTSGVEVHDAAGTPTEAVYFPGSSLGLPPVQVTRALWVSAQQNVSGDEFVAGVLGPALQSANSPWPSWEGFKDTMSTVFSTIKNNHSAALLFKREECVDGFQWLAPGDAWYRSFDGLKPPAWNGDWYKAMNGVKVIVHSGGNITRLGAPMLLDTSDENSVWYKRRGGRKAEPRWSDAVGNGGFGLTDWRYPRAVGYECGERPWWKF